MRKFFSFIIKQSVAVILIIVLVLGLGIITTGNMAINLLPDINIPMVCVQVIYPGASATSVEKDVTTELEDGLKSISGVTSVSSYSYDNLSAVVLSFDYGTDTKEKKSDITGKLNGIELPSNCDTSVYDIDFNSQALAVLSVTGDSLDKAYERAQDLKTSLAAIDGVERVELKGGGENVVKIQPFGGAELLAPLFVQAFSYGALDIPLGNVTVGGANVQIRNDSDIKNKEEILSMPIGVPSSFVTLLSSVKQIMRYYEDSTQDDLKELDKDLQDGVVFVLSEIDRMTAEEIDELAELKTYVNIASAYTAENLKSVKTSRYYNEISKQVEGKTDEELEDLSEEIGDRYPALPFTVSEDLLKVVRDGKLDGLIVFRQWLEERDGYKTAQEENSYYEPTDYEYLVLAGSGTYEVAGEPTKVGMGVFENYTPTEADADDPDNEYAQKVKFVKKTSATGLNAIADKKREEGDDYSPTDGECALLFTGTELSSEHPIITSSTFIAFVRSPNYPYNMALLIEKRPTFDDEITAEQFKQLHDELILDDVFEINLSTELISFILDTDLGELSPSASGGQVLVTSVDKLATVDFDYKEYTSYAYYAEGKMNVVKGIIVEVYKSNGANSSSVVSSVKSVCADLPDNGANIKINLLDDQSEFITDSISNVLVSMIIGGVLAVVIIFVFLKKVRLSAIIAVTMPLSVLCALICMYLMGITLNMVSLGGLAVGIGMLVDNSIVVIEAISKHHDSGKTAYRAAVDGTCEVGGALIGSTLTTVCVFLPIIFSGGLTGEIFTDLSWAVIFSLAFSLLIAVTVIPVLYSLTGGGDKQMLKAGEQATSISEVETVEEKTEPEQKSGFKKFIEKARTPYVMSGIDKLYKKILPAVISKRIITVCVALVVFGASVGLLLLTGTEFLPSIDKGQIEVNMSYGATATLDEVREDVLAFAEIINTDIDNVEYVSANIGKNGLLALKDTGIITVQLTTNRDTDKTVEAIRNLAKEKGVAGKVTVRQIDGVVASLTAGTNDLSVSVLGPSAETLGKISAEIRAKLEEAGFTDVSDSFTETSTQYSFDFDRKKIAEYGLDYTTLVTTLRIGIASYDAATAELRGESYTLRVSFIDGIFDGATKEKAAKKLSEFIVGYDGTEAIKLKDILETPAPAEGREILYNIAVEETDACITRSDGKGVISVSAALPGVDSGTAGKRMQAIASEILAKEEYSDYSFESSGVSSYLNDAFSGLAVALVISFFLLYAVMAVQFSSSVKPLIVMCSIPFSFTGGFIALVITGTSLNVVSFIGLIMLMGVIVNNAIVMLEKIAQLKDETTHLEAVKTACTERLRPILMTTLTTILALIPLAIGVGNGSELMQPLGIVVMGGLLIGTLVTLALVPAVYCLFYGISEKRPNGRQKKEKSK